LRTSAHPLLRSAVDADSAGVIGLIARVYAEYPGCILDVEKEEPGLLAPASSYDRFWVLEANESIVGCSACYSRNTAGAPLPWVELRKVYLDAALRGRGLGRLLVETAEAFADEIGASRIELWSDTRFVTAHAVYERLGYRRLAETRELHDISNSVEFHFVKHLTPGSFS
jgi:putative acetyltransferase